MKPKQKTAPAPKTADSLETLARLVGRNIRTIQRYRKDPAAPRPNKSGRHNVRAWVAFLAAHGRDAKASDTPELVALKLRKLLAEVEERELRLAVKRDEYVSLAEVKSEITTLVGQSIAVLRAKFENELPPILSGMDAIGIQEECRRAIDEVCAVLHGME
jgi:hypothetical protein